MPAMRDLFTPVFQARCFVAGAWVLIGISVPARWSMFGGDPRTATISICCFWGIRTMHGMRLKDKGTYSSGGSRDDALPCLMEARCTWLCSLLHRLSA
ncbi:hypothetical protein BDQ94DRAFT_164730 [Aspergillus welwitschiae]|uniref:Uncharacterized protein n=1 Tax=Aspergillus welwitschiae TaxID=1341132 RepID=A0A3F3PH45_9EURO|nr:hypothetical protein BDQ94DRAFT_164730 [Aspergillus welwitschiae]RDH26147.1 hypothetical protein BDQ94DRAFT_164730 [Aspergillus welwitschiae]